MAVINRMCVCQVQANNRRSVFGVYFLKKGHFREILFYISVGEFSTKSWKNFHKVKVGLSKKVFYSLIYFQLRTKLVIIARNYPGDCTPSNCLLHRSTSSNFHWKSRGAFHSMLRSFYLLFFEIGG